MDGKKIYQIRIDGIDRSIDAVKSLVTQLDALEKKINELSQKSVSITANGTTAGNNTRALKEEESLLKKIEQLHKKVADTEKKEYQELLHAKEELKEYQQIAKAIAAEANISSGVNNPNTMLGMKQQLHDIKAAMQVVDVDSDKFKNMQKQANDLNAKLLQIEKGYGQFGRNVGNYADGVAEGMQKVTISVGGVERTFNSAREASRTLNNELKSMALNGQQNTQEYKDLNEAVKQVNSTLQDTSKSSAMMDNILDTMEGFTAIGSIGVGFSRLFDIDDEKFNDTMQKFAALTLAMQGIEKLKLQMQKDEGMGKLFNAFSKPLDILSERLKGFKDKVNKSINELIVKASDFSKELEKNGYKYQGKNEKGDYTWLNKESGHEVFMDEGDLEKLKEARSTLKDIHLEGLKSVRGFTALGKVIHGLGVAAKTAGKAIKFMFSFGVAIAFVEVLTKVMDTFTDFVNSLDTTKLAAERAAEGMRAFNRELEVRMELLSSSYLKGELTDEQYLKGIYDAQTDALIKQNDALRTRAKIMEHNASLLNMLDATQNTEYSGSRINQNGTTVGRGRLTTFWNGGNDIQITVKNIGELEKAWKQCNEAIAEGNDYFDKWGTKWQQWVTSSYVTVKDTQEVMRGLGNVALGDFTARFDEVNKQFNEGKINADQYAAELRKLKKEMDGSEVLNSVIANLDKYIPDEGVREAVQNIINEIARLDDAFNMTSEGQIHYWNQVRIDAMKDGMKKEMAQIQENERHEIVEYGKTQEQINLIHNKYQRQRTNAQERADKDRLNKAREAGKKQRDAENELIALRIENMKEGLEKQLALIENERRLALQKAAGNASITAEINRKYDNKIVEEKRKWAFEIIRIYEDLEARIDQVNRATFQKEVDTATKNVALREAERIRNTGFDAILPTNYDNTKDLEAYYKKIYDIQKNALDLQTQIRQESLDREIDYDKKEEELRHKRLVDENNGEIIQQLRAGKITQEQYDEFIERENAAHASRMNAIDKEYAANMKEVTEQSLKDAEDLYSSYFDKIIANVRRDKGKIDEAMSMQPVLDTKGWEIVNIKQTRRNLKVILEQYNDLKQEILKKHDELDAALKDKKISAEDFAIKKAELDDELKSVNNSVKGVTDAQKDVISQFMQSIQQYIQAVAQSFNTIMQAVWDAQDAAFDKEQESLDKELEEIETKLEKQKELTEKYKNDIESIEDELANSRGDRRQHLIDQLNAEIAAQRASWAEEKKIEKEREKTQQKQDALENKRKKAQYKRDMMQAIVNGAMAVTMAAINHFPIPAIPMMALAASTTAAQLAIMASHKPYYADGGVLKGRSHAQGGVQLLNGQAEAEGGEYITNKRTTAKNVDLLDYINSKKKRLDLSDMVEFFNNKARANVKTISKTYLADGGVLTYNAPDLNVDDRLLQAMEHYANRPSYVSVVDIESKMDDVNIVRTMAGKR